MIIFRDFVKWANVQEAKQFYRLYGDEPVNIEEVRGSLDSPHWQFWWHYAQEPETAKRRAMIFIDLCTLAVLVPFNTSAKGGPLTRATQLKNLAEECCLGRNWKAATQLEALAKAYEAVASKRYFLAIMLASTAVSGNEQAVTARVNRVVQNLWDQGDDNVG